MHQAVVAEEVAAGVKTDALQLRVTDLAQLECRVHVDIDVVLLLGDFDVLLGGDVDVLADVGIVVLSVGVEVPVSV